MGEAGGKDAWKGEGGEALEQWRGGGRAGGRGEMEGGGPVKLTHLGSSSPVSVHGCWLSFVGDRLCSRAFVFVRGRSFSLARVCLRGRAVVSLMRCGGEPLVVGGGGSSWPFASPCCWRAVLSCRRVVVVLVSWPLHLV